MKSMRGMTPSILAEYNPKSWDAKASDYLDAISVSAPPKTGGEGKLECIVSLFQERYKSISKILKEELGFKSFGTIKEILKNRSRFIHRDVSFIGIVNDIRRTKSGGRMVELEDHTGVVTIFIRKEDPTATTLLNDEIVGVVGRFAETSDMFWTTRIQYPEVLPSHLNKGGPEYDPISIAFISDLHMGSKEFLEKEWDSMMDWMNSKDSVAENIKYLMLSGDIVDGIGVYPGHEENLDILDAFEQYEFCARKLDELPDHITPLIIPGNHDAVRLAEPQPILEPNVRQKFNSALHMGNPGRVSLNHGQDPIENPAFEMLTYHGKGIDDMVPKMAHVTYEAPAEAMKEMLKKRHLAPSWGDRNALSAQEEDQLVIQHPPDLFVTGHTHAHQMEWWRGTPLVVSSTFQGETDFMRMLGYKPKKGFLTVYNLQNRGTKVIPFAEKDEKLK